MADNKHIVDLGVFDAGMNSRAQPIMLTPGQSPDLKNVVFDDYGSVGIRSGIKTHNSDVMTYNGASAPIAGLVSYKPSTMSAMLVAFASNSTWVLTGAATTPISVPSSIGVWTQLVANGYVDTVVFQEKLFIAVNNDQLYKFNGNEFTRAGISAPTQALTAVCDAAGSLTGTYQYIYWGVNSYAAEGDYIATPSTAVAIASGNIRVNNIPTAPVSHGINTWKVGRNTAGASGIYWYLTDVANGTTSFTDTLADSSLVDLAPVDQGYPRKFQFIIAYGNRLWGAIEDYLWYSNINQPEEFPSENFIRVGRGDGMEISAITAFMGQICISKSDYNGKLAFYTLTIGDSVTFADPENWYLALKSGSAGAESHRGCVTFENYLLLPSRNGVYTYDGATVGLSASESGRGAVLSENLALPVADRFRANAAGVSAVAMKPVAAINSGGRILLSHPKNTSQPRNNNTLFYDYRRIGGKSAKNGAWSETPAIGSTQFVVHEGKLFGGSPTTGYIFEWDNGTLYQNGLDFGSQIAAYYVTAPIHGSDGHEERTKDFRWVIISEKGAGSVSGGSDPDGAAITVTFYVDGTSLSSATLVHTETYYLRSSGRDYKIKLPSTASGKRLWIKYAWTGENAVVVSESDACRLSRIKICYTLRGLRNA